MRRDVLISAIRLPAGVRLGLLLLLLLPVGLRAEGRASSSVDRSGFPEVRDGWSVPLQQVLEQEALRFSRAWVDGDVGGLESMLGVEGIRLHVDGDFYPSVEARRAAMTLRAFLGKYRPGEVEVMRVSQASGTAPRGFADLQWRTQVAGTGESVIFTLFVAFTMEETGWTVTEIRVLS
jgi:hypothetical protein